MTPQDAQKARISLAEDNRDAALDNLRTATTNFFASQKQHRQDAQALSEAHARAVSADEDLALARAAAHV
ncbi:MAG: hypothetical protein B7Z62_00280 [Deltaproteobacteria bacterium 37-65-8]|nr:MAG: hypothetical protein B7Z62_00280 [Deltaproteobacteria bacterium 37-65-8]